MSTSSRGDRGEDVAGRRDAQGDQERGAPATKVADAAEGGRGDGGGDEPRGHGPAGRIRGDAELGLDERDEGDDEVLQKSDGGDRDGDRDQDRGG
jgi:hypothetical protein